MIRSRRIAWLTASISVLALTSCSLAPEYQRPEMPIPQNYKEAGDWLPAHPEAASVDRGPWWEAYHDADLNALEQKLSVANQDLKAAVARYDQARAEADVARAAYFPSFTANASAARVHLARNTMNVPPHRNANNYALSGDLSYELDVWGKVRNAVKAGESRADASAADLAAMDLSLHAELAMDYFALRGQEKTEQVADDAVKSYQKAFTLTQARHEGGAAAETDVDQAETQLNNAKTLAADARLKRAQLEHAIAVLVGEVPSNFAMEDKASEVALPPTIAGVASNLIAQRPDIAASALRVEAANAEIGVARAAYLPDFTFGGTAGFESTVLSKLISAPSLLWSVGPGAALTMFDGGRISALSDEARAAYDESVANYRQNVLIAFQEVEDNLVALRQYEQESKTQAAADKAANRALAQAKNRYEGGITTYIDVVVAQNQALQADLDVVDLRTRQLTASLMLVKALGGDWHKNMAATETNSH